MINFIANQFNNFFEICFNSGISFTQILLALVLVNGACYVVRIILLMIKESA